MKHYAVLRGVFAATGLAALLVAGIGTASAQPERPGNSHGADAGRRGNTHLDHPQRSGSVVHSEPVRPANNYSMPSNRSGKTYRTESVRPGNIYRGNRVFAGQHPPSFLFDQRYHHDRYYPPSGYAVRTLPSGSLRIGIGSRGTQLFFNAGVWFRPVGGQFIVTMPPFGIVIPVLPPGYATVWLGGFPYYYANDVYYAVAPGQGYRVVAPPPGADTVQPLPAPIASPAPPEPIIYPRIGRT